MSDSSLRFATLYYTLYDLLRSAKTVKRPDVENATLTISTRALRFWSWSPDNELEKVPLRTAAPLKGTNPALLHHLRHHFAPLKQGLLLLRTPSTPTSRFDHVRSLINYASLNKTGGHSIAPKTISANAPSASP